MGEAERKGFIAKKSVQAINIVLFKKFVLYLLVFAVATNS